MIIVRAALVGNVDLSYFTRELSRVNACLCLDLLEGVDRGQEEIRVKVYVGVADSVQREIIPFAAVAGNGKPLCAAIATLARAGLTTGGKGGTHVRAKSH